MLHYPYCNLRYTILPPQSPPILSRGRCGAQFGRTQVASGSGEGAKDLMISASIAGLSPREMARLKPRLFLLGVESSGGGAMVQERDGSVVKLMWSVSAGRRKSSTC
ncbi:hypothetical protein M758_11G074200 [Ceratodon purpureus]|nr:hypothetical protein M758_11G074200 [Ceratodon purpureus]